MALIEHILSAYDAADAARAPVLGTVVDLQGSGYRRPGARILIEPDGRYVGAISGGCLEKDAARHAREWVADGPTTVLFDTRSNELHPLGEYGTGCEGVVHLFLQRLPVANGALDPLSAIRGLRESGQGATLVTAYDANAHFTGPLGSLAVVSASDVSWAQACPERLRPRIERAARKTLADQQTSGLYLDDDASRLRVLLEYVRPRVELTVVGTGRDAAALVSVASSMDWRIRVVGTDPMALSRPAFDEVETICIDGVRADSVSVGSQSYVVQMTHDLELDARLLPVWMAAEPAYLGLLGPRRRTARLLSELHVRGQIPGADIDTALDSLSTPVGLDLGGEDPYEVALSIVAEIVAAKNGRTGGPLSERAGPIHDPHQIVAGHEETA